METGFRTTSDTNLLLLFLVLISIVSLRALKYKSFELNQERHYTQQYTSKQSKPQFEFV